MASVIPIFKLKSTEPKDKPSLIYLIVYYRNKRFKYSTGQKIEPTFWDGSGQKASPVPGNKVKSQDHNDINFQINRHSNAIVLLFDDYSKKGIIPSIKTVRDELTKALYTEEKEEPKKQMTLNRYIGQFIKEIEKGTRLTDKGMKYVLSTVKNYKAFKVQFDLFQEQMHRKYNFNDITIDFYDDYVQYFIKKNYSLNTIGRHIKNMKTIMKVSKEEGFHTNTEPERKKFKILKTDTDQIYLTEDELTRMYDLDLSGNNEKELARDIFMIGCYTALRFSDYSRIRKEHIRTTAQGNRVIHIITKKTGEPVIIPLEWHWRLDELLKKYDYTIPKIYEQKLNQRIKDVGQDAKIEEPVEIEQLKGGLKVKKTVAKYKLIKTHTARRSGATNMYKYGIPSIDIMKITGHKKESNFMLYIKQSKEETADRIVREFKVTKPLKKVSDE